MGTDSVTHLAYQGHLLKGEGEVMYAFLRGKGHRANVCLIFYDPLDPKFKLTRGVMASINLKDEPTTWTMILTRSLLEDTEAQALLGRRNLMAAKKVDYVRGLSTSKDST